MPTNQPSNAPDNVPDQARDDTSAAAVIADERLDDTPGGGGLGGTTAADAAAQPQRGATPNTPADAPAPHDPGSLTAAEEARRLSDTSEAHLRSQ